jgi:uncharacterized protein
MENSMPVTRFPPPKAKPWYAQRWPWLLMLGPLVVVAAGTYTMWLAFSRPDALVVDDYYLQGKAMNQDLRRDRVASGLGLALGLRYDAAGGKLSGTIVSAKKQPIGKIEIHLIHSTQPEKDIKLAAQPDAKGDFSVGLALLDITRWQVLVQNEQRDWRLNGVWLWPAQKEIVIQADPATLD